MDKGHWVTYLETKHCILWYEKYVSVLTIMVHLEFQWASSVQWYSHPNKLSSIR